MKTYSLVHWLKSLLTWLHSAAERVTRASRGKRISRQRMVSEIAKLDEVLKAGYVTSCTSKHQEVIF